MSNFREFDRETGFLLPPSLDEWLPEQHLARFVVEVIDGLDLSATLVYGAVKSAENLFSFLAQRALGIVKKVIDGVEQSITKAIAGSLLLGLGGIALHLSGGLG